MLAYLFWHWPRPGVDPASYAQAVVAFHRALAAAPPRGFVGSRVLEVKGAPWMGAPEGLEDWYLVEDFAALGVLNDAAIAGTLRDPHGAAARLAVGGAGGVYRRLAEGRPGVLERTAWLSKPAGTSYAEFLARLPAGERWQRQLVLGPAPEFCLPGGAAPAGADARTLAVRPVYASPSLAR